jgi:hypothetical protein
VGLNGGKEHWDQPCWRATDRIAQSLCDQPVLREESELERRPKSEGPPLLSNQCGKGKMPRVTRSLPLTETPSSEKYYNVYLSKSILNRRLRQRQSFRLRTAGLAA